MAGGAETIGRIGRMGHIETIAMAVGGIGLAAMVWMVKTSIRRDTVNGAGGCDYGAYIREQTRNHYRCEERCIDNDSNS